MSAKEHLFNRPDSYRWTEAQAKLEDKPPKRRLSRGSRAVITQIMAKIQEEALCPGETLELEIGRKRCDLAAIPEHLAENHNIQGISLAKHGKMLAVSFNPPE